MCGTTASPLLVSRYQTSGTSKSVVDSAPVKWKKTRIDDLINLSKGGYSGAKRVLGMFSLCVCVFRPEGKHSSAAKWSPVNGWNTAS